MQPAVKKLQPSREIRRKPASVGHSVHSVGELILLSACGQYSSYGFFAPAGASGIVGSWTVDVH